VERQQFCRSVYFRHDLVAPFCSGSKTYCERLATGGVQQHKEGTILAVISSPGLGRNFKVRAPSIRFASLALTFLFTTPGWESTLGGFPALSAPVGQFLLKDIVLLGAAVFTAGEAFAAVSAL
jgi:hypothetical protein